VFFREKKKKRYVAEKSRLHAYTGQLLSSPKEGPSYSAFKRCHPYPHFADVPGVQHVEKKRRGIRLTTLQNSVFSSRGRFVKDGFPGERKLGRGPEKLRSKKERGLPTVEG